MAKKVLFSFEVKPGMVIAEDLYNPAGQLVLPAGFVLDEATISKLTLRLLFLKQNRQTTIIQITLIIPRN